MGSFWPLPRGWSTLGVIKDPLKASIKISSGTGRSNDMARLALCGAAMRNFTGPGHVDYVITADEIKTYLDMSKSRLKGPERYSSPGRKAKPIARELFLLVPVAQRARSKLVTRNL